MITVALFTRFRDRKLKPPLISALDEMEPTKRERERKTGIRRGKVVGLISINV